ncbi:hypothetical protein LSH36_8g08046 [Paralvinella palmiformis]|uniref:Uncharacterized protein n=1 Tax=Paralvinella palmiformis TaxID=53620 RepID=A0AAD9NGX6_9ANNE|nr:hypothetical protein LSH36_8g08046 [Paralvinella palmiformis]
MASFWRAHSHVIFALGAGIAVGASITLLVHRLSHTFGRDLSRLIIQIENLKHDVELLRSTLEQNTAVSAQGYYSVHESSGEDDDEFQEAFEGNEEQFQDRSLTSDDFVSIPSSESLSSSAAFRLFREVDSLLDGDDDDKQRAFDLLKAEEESLRIQPEYLWRMAKAAFSLSQIEGAKGDEEEKKRFIYMSKDFAVRSLQFNGRNSNAHKWCAITLGSVGDYEGTQTKILNGFKFKEHIEKAIEIAPNDPSSLHLMGRWCYGVYMLSWLERKAAAALFATPPTATIDEALENFLKADKLSPGKWKENTLFIAKCYIEKRDYYSAVEWLDKANNIESISQDDRNSQKEIDNFLYQYGAYRR